MSEQTTAEPAVEEKAEPEEQVRGIRIADKVYESPGDFTLEEARTIKEHIGMTPQELILGVRVDPTDPTLLWALAWVCLSREEPDVGWEDERIGKSSTADFFEIPDEEPDANPPASRRKKSS